MPATLLRISSASMPLRFRAGLRVPQLSREPVTRSSPYKDEITARSDHGRAVGGVRLARAKSPGTVEAPPARQPEDGADESQDKFEVPFFIIMVVLNLVIIAVILNAAAVLPFLPDRLQDTGWATAIRTALIGLLLLVPT